MAKRVLEHTSKELSLETWPDFNTLFTKGNGWDFCACMHFHRPRSLPQNFHLRTRAERGLRNLREKRDLVEAGRAHGILVYANGEPVGWCQYGPQEELPRFDHSRNYQGHAPKNLDKIWRISCFVVDKKYRQQGIATAALKAALEAIRKKGGGVVEAFPPIPWQKLCRERIRRCGHAPSFGNASTHGTLSMFKKFGFKVVAPYGLTNVIVRKRV